MPRYRDIDTDAPDYEPLPFYSSDTDMDGDLDLAAWLADTSSTTASPAVPEAAGLSVAGLGNVIEAPAAAEEAVEDGRHRLPVADFDAELGDAAAN